MCCCCCCCVHLLYFLCPLLFGGFFKLEYVWWYVAHIATSVPYWAVERAFTNRHLLISSFSHSFNNYRDTQCATPRYTLILVQYYILYLKPYQYKWYEASKHIIYSWCAVFSSMYSHFRRSIENTIFHPYDDNHMHIYTTNSVQCDLLHVAVSICGVPQ